MRYRFLPLFVALLATMLVYPALRGPGGSAFAANLLITVMCAAGARTILGDPKRNPLSLLVVAPPALGVWLGYFSPGDPAHGMVVLVHAGSIVFHVHILVVALRSVYREPKITADGVFAAMCGYVLLGVAFGHVYSIVEVVAPGSFKMDDSLTRGDEHLALTYFSFITLATVGYGDVLPASRTARSLAVVEALLGQCYIAVLVADLIGKRLSQSEPDA